MSKAVVSSKAPFSSEATVTSKGQITIPREVRERLSLNQGDEVIFDIEDERISLRAQKKQKIADVFAKLQGSSIPFESREAEKQAVARYFAEKSQ